MSPQKSIVTHRGDDGFTDLIHGTRISKDSRPIHALGDMDELNSLIGAIRSLLPEGPIASSLRATQHDLFHMGNAVATLTDAPQDELWVAEKIVRLEEEIKNLEAQLPALHAFLLPGGAPGAALLHVARAVCRRAERNIAGLAEAGHPVHALLQYLNRLSDLLFLQARAVNMQQECAETLWDSTV
jgi:cob(I)alamin adenosyltransferase